MKDRIELRGLRVVAVHGLLPHESQVAQPFELDLDLELDLGPAGRNDDLTLGVDYGLLVRVASQSLTGPPAGLLEALAERVAAAVLDAAPSAETVTVGIRKLHPPVPADLASAGVRIERRR